MSNDLLQKKYERLLDLARRMRGYQKEYQKYHSSQDQKRMRELERQIDQFLGEETARIKSKQSEIF